MDEIIGPVKELLELMKQLGWEPLPFVFSTLAVFGIRIVLEPDSLEINSDTSRKYAGIMRIASWAIAITVSLLMQYAITKPIDKFAGALVVGISIGNGCAAYIIYSFFGMLNVSARIKEKLGWTPKSIVEKKD